MSDPVSSATKRARLVAAIAGPDPTIAPGVFDMISARVADQSGFSALYMTGYGIAASHLGLPDAGLSSYADMVGRARTICEGTTTPVVADADTGFGGLLNVAHTVRGYEDAGVGAIQLEDQEFPKKCGHAKGRRVIPTRDMQKKIEVACDARRNDDFLIIARTDSRSSLGLDEAISRGQAYAASGADLVFVESPESHDEFRKIRDTIDAPLVANMVEGGFTPLLTHEQLVDLEFALVLYPGSGFLAVAQLLTSMYADLRDNGTSLGAAEPIMPIPEMHTLMGFDDVWAFDERWADD